MDVKIVDQSLFAAAMATIGSSLASLSPQVIFCSGPRLSTFVVLEFAGDAGGPGSCGAVVGSGCIRLPGLLRAL